MGSKSQDKPMEGDPVVLSQKQRYVSSSERGTGTYISTGLNISTQNINLACILIVQNMNYNWKGQGH